MAYDINIQPGRPPLLWSEVSDAFAKVNENFQILEAALGASGITPIDFSNLASDIIPSIDNKYYLGKNGQRYKAIYASTWVPGGDDAINGVWVGSAQIKGIGAHVDIPLGSTLGGSLIFDPDKTFFKTIDVDHNNSIVATGYGDTVQFLSGTGIQMAVDSSAESITFSNTGILSIADGSGISHSTASGVSTITNTGVRSLQNVASLPSGRTQGVGINITGSTGDNIKITNTGVISISSGVGITVSTDTATGDVTITNSAPAVNAFTQVEVNGDSANRLLADAPSDVLNIASGQGITLTKNTSTDTLTITVNPVFDLKGSVFGDDSSLLVDALENKIYAGNGFFGNLTGNADTATTAAAATTVTLVATNTAAADHFITFVDTATGNENVRTDTSLTYNPTSNTLTAGTFATGSLTITGSTIGTTDSSGIIVNELTTFNTDVTFENDIIVFQRITVNGSRVVSLVEWKSLVAASTSFTDFQAKVAALV